MGPELLSIDAAYTIDEEEAFLARSNDELLADPFVGQFRRQLHQLSKAVGASPEVRTSGVAPRDDYRTERVLATGYTVTEPPRWSDAVNR